MSNKLPLAELTIRTAVVHLSDLGYIAAADTKTEMDEPHTITFKWDRGKFTQGDRNYNAHSLCIITKPEPGLVDISEQGYYSVTTANGFMSGDVLESSQPPSKETRYGGFRSVSEIAGRAFVVGLRGLVYRLDELKLWTRIDDGLPKTFNIQAIHGFNATDIYAVGRKGEVWHYDGKIWQKLDMPTNANLTSVKCAVDRKVYITGHSGALLCGSGETWEVINHESTNDDLWDVEWFEDKVYVSSMSSVYRLEGQRLVKVDFGNDTPKTCYQLSTADGVMWSNGEDDIMSFDGNVWTRIV
ncbi:hypothetical protein C8R34_13033 [Nitrosomonas sp. Nm84]|uniref:hypothetical protein n=1 Tax=Nitrosomonas sp. Nm84 TaxID=200124 RepID=UPI000D767D45|nr:hypothetical protein [Nitrosomonas sp. Nm84]PXW82682.1 hypothetical protein C8R34_13033 [Nitrosomonas sp. Nm84]